jgi:hypothetical protein
MAGMSTYLENAVLNFLFSKTEYTAPDKYVALYSSAPTDDGGGTELSGNGYARVLSNSWSTSTTGTLSNSVAITFEAATGDWTATHFGIFDNSTEGNLLGWGQLTTPKTVQSGDIATFAIGALVATLD